MALASSDFWVAAPTRSAPWAASKIVASRKLARQCSTNPSARPRRARTLQRHQIIAFANPKGLEILPQTEQARNRYLFNGRAEGRGDRGAIGHMRVARGVGVEVVTAVINRVELARIDGVLHAGREVHDGIGQLAARTPSRSRY